MLKTDLLLLHDLTSQHTSSASFKRGCSTPYTIRNATTCLFSDMTQTTRNGATCQEAAASSDVSDINPLNAELNPIRHLLAFVGARHFVHVSRIRG
jgi:hypothetical protein